MCGGVQNVEVINNLTSTSTDKPLSANMGKVLNDTKLGFIRAIIVEDFNNIMENGIYYQDGNDNASQCPNIPTPYAGKLVVNNSKSAYPTIYQVYHSYGLSNTIYYRTYYNGIWYTWKNTNEIDGRSSVDFMNRGSWWDRNDFSKNANNENNNINFAYASTHGMDILLLMLVVHLGLLLLVIQ